MKTKKIVAGLLIAVSLASSAFAASKKKNGAWYNSYSGGVKEGQLIIDAGLGLNGNVEQGGDLTSYIPPLELTAEYTVRIAGLPFGIGGFVGYTGYATKEEVLTTTVTRERDAFYTGPMVNYHFNFLKELDIYASGKTGICFKDESKKVKESGVTTFSDDDSWKTLHFAATAGATYYFNDMFGVNVEVGFPTILRVAGSVKLAF